jgi:hypothetical protein
MNDLLLLWLPILVAAVSVFVASSLIHMVFKWHNSDYQKLSNEDAVLATIRAGSPVPGQYVLPHCADMKDLQNEEMQKKFREGPVGFMTLKQPGPPAMGGALLKWFVFNIVVAVVAGAVAMHVYGLHAEANRAAGCLVGVLSFLTYAGGSIQAGIWMGKPWGSVAKDLLDGAIYAAVSGLSFCWLWP